MFSNDANDNNNDDTYNDGQFMIVKLFRSYAKWAKM